MNKRITDTRVIQRCITKYTWMRWLQTLQIVRCTMRTRRLEHSTISSPKVLKGEQQFSNHISFIVYWWMEEVLQELINVKALSSILNFVYMKHNVCNNDQMKTSTRTFSAFRGITFLIKTQWTKTSAHTHPRNLTD